MRLSDFDYDLPKELIAQYPLKERDACRLLVVNRADGSIKHRRFGDITAYLRQDDLLVMNDTRVRTCRLRGRRKTGGAIEVLLLRRKTGLCFEAMFKPGRLKQGERIYFSDPSVTATRTGPDEVAFEAASPEAIYAIGEIPLPPYIKRRPEPMDAEYYQTVYAACDGSIASPTAGLHFTEALLDRIRSLGVHTAYVTLHVGSGTFRSVTAEDIRSHVMAEEYFTVPPMTQSLLKQARADPSKRIIAVGTTTCRALESYAQGRSNGATGLFMYPGYRFRLIDGLLTNFHLPRTTLFMLVCAFAGTALTREAYAQAVRERYRFYSYGDAMLVV
ncbi:MAG TPA: tRNA preQ1(34) S-adenosylmethionine ribosyltransferase-isomerase QueA [Candidatus Omnitrophota bacterium]|nr:tRNA preQ1(34) S-adenosylmethionine ribosyltransferase-isomerase QueA [Candidatus Omnitrophota bacterium]